MQIVAYSVYGAALLAAAYAVFRRIVRRSYKKSTRLEWPVSLLQLAVFAAFFCMPYLYLPQEWAWNWWPDGTWNRWTALILVAGGMGLAFGTMIWFGIGRAFGVKVTGLRTNGLYRLSRNPQTVGGWLMVVGVTFYKPSGYAIGWLLIWAIIGHWMITTEEEHLRQVFGVEYEEFCRITPRYLVLRRD